MGDAENQLYAEALRRLERQERGIDDVRSRALTVLGSAGLVMGLFGIRSISGQHAHGWHLFGAYVAACAFVICALLAMATQRRIKKLDVGDSLTVWLERARTPGLDLTDYATKMAHGFVAAVDHNRPRAAFDGNLLRLAVVAFATEVIAWTVAVVL